MFKLFLRLTLAMLFLAALPAPGLGSAPRECASETAKGEAEEIDAQNILPTGSELRFGRPNRTCSTILPTVTGPSTIRSNVSSEHARRNGCGAPLRL